MGTKTMATVVCEPEAGGKAVAPRLKCRWCRWSCPLWTRFKNGKRKMRYDLLNNHIEDCHPSEAYEIQELSRVDRVERDRYLADLAQDTEVLDDALYD